jgi:predicted alpha/beta hydrolase
MEIKFTKINCEDGFELTVTIYFPKTYKAAVIIAPATGIKRTFYNSFASFLAENGYGVICFDNRGIGDSKQGNINNGNASLINWGQQDMTAVLNQLKVEFPNTTYHLIGHSAGGQLVGLMKNAEELASMLNFASSSGSLRNMRFPFTIQAQFFLNFFIPANNFFFGKTYSQWVGMGEPLPKMVAKQWSKWCNGTGYVATTFGKEIMEHLYDNINIPSKWLFATDDNIANQANVKDMVRVYSKTKAEIVALNPTEYGFKEIGHMKFFSSKYSILWKMALDWLHQHSNTLK